MKASARHKERRRAARIYKTLNILFSEAENIRNLGSVDLSPMGLRFRTDSKVPLFRHLDFKIDLSRDGEKHDELSCRATVIRCEKSQKAKGFHVTLFFHDLSKKDARKIEKFISESRG